MKRSGYAVDKNIEENIIKEVKNLFRLKNLKKETNDAAIKDTRTRFRLKKKTKHLNTD